MVDPLKIAGREFPSRLLVGTGKFSSPKIMRASLEASEASLVTVALRRLDLSGRQTNLLDFIDRKHFSLLPNTSGARTAKEAVFLAKLAREAGLGNLLKLEVIPDPQYLLPDPIETLEAARLLVQDGFVVFPYLHADPVLAKRLADVGCPVVMPLGSPIGSNRGLKMREAIRIIIEQSFVPVIVDAGLGSPSHAAEAMELGADGVLVNTAIATAEDPVGMARAFRLGVEAGRTAYRAGLAAQKMTADASSPLIGVMSG